MEAQLEYVVMADVLYNVLMMSNVYGYETILTPGERKCISFTFLLLDVIFTWFQRKQLKIAICYSELFHAIFAKVSRF